MHYIDSDNEVKMHIMGVYEELTPVEKSIADFFQSNTEMMDFSSKNIARTLYVSEAALSRFAKKCGYKGYRELVYNYETMLSNEKKEKDISILAARVRSIYQKLQMEDFACLNEKQMRRIALMLNGAGRVNIYGMGSSGLAAKEFQLRFMRLGLMVEAVTDSQLMKISASLQDERSVVVIITLSGRTEEVITAAKIAHKRHASLIIITANRNLDSLDIFDEVVYVASTRDLEEGTYISPQFPLLVMIDILYAYYFANDSFLKEQTHKMTLNALAETKKQ